MNFDGLRPLPRLPRLPLLACLLLGVQVASAAPACQALTGVPTYSPMPAPFDTIQRVQNLCYADGLHWDEAQYTGGSDVTLWQTSEYYRPRGLGPRRAMPLILWAHPNGGSQEMFKDASPTLMNKLVVPALTNGFAFLSIEFRHPRASVPVVPVYDANHQIDIPNTDIAQAVQWVREHATELGVVPADIYLVGRSRGSLALLTAFMRNQHQKGSTDFRRQSSRPRAVFAVQAQTTYQHDELRDDFVMLHSTDPFGWPAGQPPAIFDYHAYLDQVDLPFKAPGSALQAWDASDPPVWLRYERTPPAPDQATVVPVGTKVAEPEMDPNKGVCHEAPDTQYPWAGDSGCFDVHHPSFGKQLALVSAAQGGGRGVGIQYGPPPDTTDAAVGRARLDEISAHFYDGYVCFFIQHMTANGQKQRRAVMGPGGTDFCTITDQPWPPL
jgi:hypothetical protein